MYPSSWQNEEDYKAADCSRPCCHLSAVLACCVCHCAAWQWQDIQWGVVVTGAVTCRMGGGRGGGDGAHPGATGDGATTGTPLPSLVSQTQVTASGCWVHVTSGA